MIAWSASVAPKTHGCVPCKSNMPRSRPGLGRLSRSRPGAGCRVPVDQQIGDDAFSAQRFGREGSSERSRACETYSEHRGEHEAPRAPSQTSDGYSVAQDAYREELAFQRRRARRRRIGACLRVLALIVLIPLGLAAVFVGSYVLTCIINGATPEEVLDVLAAMPSRVESFVRSVMAM